MKEVDIRVTGRVQGVFYRQSAKQMAEWLKLVGYARNVDDGSVHLHVKGEDEAVHEFIEWCRTGPEHALVDDIQIFTAQESVDTDAFTIT